MLLAVPANTSSEIFNKVMLGDRTYDTVLYLIALFCSFVVFCFVLFCLASFFYFIPFYFILLPVQILIADSLCV